MKNKLKLKNEKKKKYIYKCKYAQTTNTSNIYIFDVI